MNNRYDYIPREQRKKILLLSDDARLPSGVGVMSKEIIVGTAHRFNWTQISAAMVHPENGKVLDASESLSKEIGIPDAYLRLYPSSGYGDPQLLRNVMDAEKPDAIMIFTDPRYFIWLFQLEHEIREKCPIIYYNIWDSLPFPKYNQPYYRSVDALFAISRQTYNINKQVLTDKYVNDVLVKYVPHGINENSFFKYTDAEDLQRASELRKRMFNGEEVDFVVLYNNRNIRRKMTGDVILAYREFFLKLTPDQQKKTRLLLHTQPVDDNGTDLIRLIHDCAPEIHVTFSPDRVDVRTVNDIYNNSDLVVNYASNEGFGLGTMEALMAERMISLNVTGGLQDQCGFVDENGDYLHEDIHYNAEWGSNHDGRYKDAGQWVVPVFPNNRALIGSPPTPYIFDDRCDWKEAGEAIYKVYNMGPVERALRGKLGREYALKHGFSAKSMCEKFIEGTEELFATWKPRKRFDLVKV